MAADIEPREMEEGKTEELENMANICFNLPRKKQEIVSNSQIQKRGVKLFHKKLFDLILQTRPQRNFPRGDNRILSMHSEKSISPELHQL